MFDTDRPPELHVPASALERPAGAVVGADGTVACVACQTRISLASADIVGQGYRCQKCSAAAHVASLGGKGDAAAHLDAGDRSSLVAASNKLFGIAALTAVGAAGVFAFGGSKGPEIAIGMGVAAVGSLVLGISRRRAAR